jgi:hypothetical protein
MTKMKIAAAATFALALSVPGVTGAVNSTSGANNSDRTIASIPDASTWASSTTGASLAGAHGYQLAREEGGFTRMD